MALAGFVGSAHAAADDKRDITNEDLVNAPELLDVQISPDGKQVLYEVRRTLYERNEYQTELWLRDADGKTAARRLVAGPPVKSPFQSLRAQWAPDGRSFLYFATRDGSSLLTRYTLSDAREEVLLTQEWAATDPRHTHVQFAKMSPDGKTLAFAAAKEPAKSVPMRGIVAGTEWWRPQAGPNASLWLLDIATKLMKRMTEPTMHVSEVTWSPDGTRIAFGAAPSAKDSPYIDDLYVLDVRSGKIRPLVQQQGWDHEAVWSPDGRSIAFVSQKGTLDLNYASWIAVVPADGGTPRYYFDAFQQQSGSVPANLRWTMDGKRLLFTELYHFGRHLFEGDLNTNEVRQLSANGHYYQRYSFSADARRVALTIEDVTTPSDVYVTSLPWREPRKLTELHPDWNDIRRTQVLTTKWRSRDNRFDVEGVVILPANARPGERHPTLLYMPGGPSMPRMGFMMDEPLYPFLVFAARGYAVFIPSSRGRGGFGKEFRDAMPRNSDVMPGPFADVMAGIDNLIARGIADPNKLAFSGFSYGGILGSYVLAHTTRFKAGGINEGYPNHLRLALRYAGSAHWRQLLKDQEGLGSPWNEKDLRVLWENSPIYAMDHAKTPTLLEFGELSGAHDEGVELYSALQYFNVPSMFIVYPRSGHGNDEPKLLMDSYQRQLNWFDYWVLGKGQDPRGEQQ
ncbi:MAG: prolyl oligopeptidase family serine peptidase [Rudaea sp.]|uniref:S9 family peptidase n=1 Tax=Rudaea sp. TaxID=2136325 RepID=UPI0039E7217B